MPALESRLFTVHYTGSQEKLLYDHGGAESAYGDNNLHSNTVEEPQTQAISMKEIILGLKLLK